MTRPLLIDNIGEIYSVKLEQKNTDIKLYIFNGTECFSTTFPDFKLTEEKCDYPWFSQNIWTFPSSFLDDQRGYTGFIIKEDDKIIMDICWLFNYGKNPIDMHHVLVKTEMPLALSHAPHQFTVCNKKIIIAKNAPKTTQHSQSLMITSLFEHPP